MVLIPLQYTHAASFSFSPSTGSYQVGSTIKVRVVAASSAASINAVSGTVTFSSDTLSLTGISKQGSIVSLWAQEPTYSNASGTASFEGVILNGYQGSGATVLTLTFKTKKEGSAKVSLGNNASILLNDGNGTNVLQGVSSAEYTVTPAPVVTPKEKEKEKTPVIEPVQPAPQPVVEIPASVQPVVVEPIMPVITEYAADMLAHNFIVVKGTAAPHAKVVLTVVQGKDFSEDTVVFADENGLFTYVSSQKMPRGMYTLSASSIRDDGTYARGEEIQIHLHASWIMVISKVLSRLFTIKIPLIIVVGIVLIGAVISYLSIQQFQRRKERQNLEKSVIKYIRSSRKKQSDV